MQKVQRHSAADKLIAVFLMLATILIEPSHGNQPYQSTINGVRSDAIRFPEDEPTPFATRNFHDGNDGGRSSSSAPYQTPNRSPFPQRLNEVRFLYTLKFRCFRCFCKMLSFLGWFIGLIRISKSKQWTAAAFVTTHWIFNKRHCKDTLRIQRYASPSVWSLLCKQGIGRLIFVFKNANSTSGARLHCISVTHSVSVIILETLPIVVKYISQHGVLAPYKLDNRMNTLPVCIAKVIRTKKKNNCLLIWRK